MLDRFQFLPDSGTILKTVTTGQEILRKSKLHFIIFIFCLFHGHLYWLGRECWDAPLRITWEPSLNPHIAVFAFEYFAIFAKFARLLPSLNPSYLPLYKSCLGVCLPVLARSDGKWLPESNQFVRREPRLWLCDTICVCKKFFVHLDKPSAFNVYFYLLPPEIIEDFDFYYWFK